MKKDIIKLAGLADGQVGSADSRFLERLASEDPGVREELETQKNAGQCLREAGLPYKTDANGDFFWSQVSRQIDAEEARRHQPFAVANVLSVFKHVWAPALAAIVVVSAVLYHPILKHPATYARVLEAKTSLREVSVTPFESKKSHVTVIWIEGLDYLYANPDIVPDAS